MGGLEACFYRRPCRCDDCSTSECNFPFNIKFKQVGPRGGTRELKRYGCPCRQLDYKNIKFEVDFDDELINDDEMCKICITKMKVTKTISSDGKYTDIKFECENEHKHLQIMQGYIDAGKYKIYNKKTNSWVSPNDEEEVGSTCPLCHTEIFKNTSVKCKYCSTIICNSCSIYNYDKYEYACRNCDSNTREKIQEKVFRCKMSDMENFGERGNLTVDDVLELIQKQTCKCYVCDERVLTSRWESHCCYQFVISKINPTKLYDRDNVLISCYYCASRHYSDFKQNNKVCKAGCHTDPKDGIILRKQVSKDKIENLLLK